MSTHVEPPPPDPLVMLALITLGCVGFVSLLYYLWSHIMDPIMIDVFDSLRR